MRGTDARSGSLFSFVDLEQRVPARHPLRVIKGIVDDVLVALDAEFAKLYEGTGRQSIAPERLLRASLLQAFYPKAARGNDPKTPNLPATQVQQPAREKQLLDIPYSVNVISSDLITNTMASRSDDVFTSSPVVQLFFPTGASHGITVGDYGPTGARWTSSCVLRCVFRTFKVSALTNSSEPKAKAVPNSAP